MVQEARISINHASRVEDGQTNVLKTGMEKDLGDACQTLRKYLVSCAPHLPITLDLKTVEREQTKTFGAQWGLRIFTA